MSIKTLMKKSKTIFATALFVGLASCLIPQTAKADKLKVDVNVAVQEEQDSKSNTILFQNLFTYGSNRFIIEQTKDSERYGLNLENKDFKLNLGIVDKEENDSGRILVKHKFDKGFLGAEVQLFEEAEKEDIWGGYGGVKINERFDIEAALNTDESLRAVLFAKTGEKSMIGVGGGKGKNGYLEGNVTYSQKLSERYGIGAHLRIMDSEKHKKNRLDARLRLGPNVSWQKARAFGVANDCYNSLLAHDITSLANIGGFGFYSADGCVGDKTGDIGLDVRHIRDVKNYANLAVNVGDYGIFQDVIVSPEIHRNLADKTDGARLGLSTKLKDTGVKVWYQLELNEKQDTTHAVMVGATF